MTDKTQPEALRLADAIKASGQFTNLHTLDEASAELRRQHARIAELEAQLEAVVAGGVQALSAAPAGWESVIDEARSGLQDSEPSAFDNSGYRAFAETVLDAVEEGLSALAASPTPPAEQQAAPKAAPGEPSWWRKRADEIEVQVALTGSPEAMRCYTDMRTLLQAAAGAAPQQEAQEQVATKTKRVRSLLDYEPKTGAFFWKSTFGRAKAGTEAGYIHTDKRGGQYRCIKLDGQIHQAHRLVFLHCFGIDPGEFEVDHIDGDKLNNAIANLRLVTHKQNSENRKLGENNTSGYMGVCWIEQHQVWRAMITHNNRRIFIGHFKTAEMAHEAYEAKRAELFTHDEGRHLTQPGPAPLSEREAFERDWEKRHAPVPINGRTHDDGRYGDSSIQDAWESWQARAALAARGDE